MSTFNIAGSPASSWATSVVSALRALEVVCASPVTPVRRPAARSIPSSPGRPTLALPSSIGGAPVWCQYRKPTPAPSPSSSSSLTSTPCRSYTCRIDPVTQWWAGNGRNPGNGSSAIMLTPPAYARRSVAAAPHPFDELLRRVGDQHGPSRHWLPDLPDHRRGRGRQPDHVQRVGSVDREPAVGRQEPAVQDDSERRGELGGGGHHRQPSQPGGEGSGPKRHDRDRDEHHGQGEVRRREQGVHRPVQRRRLVATRRRRQADLERQGHHRDNRRGDARAERHRGQPAGSSLRPDQEAAQAPQEPQEKPGPDHEQQALRPQRFPVVREVPRDLSDGIAGAHRPRSNTTAAAPTRSAPYPLAAPHRSHLVSFMTPPFHGTAARHTLSPEEARAKRRAARGGGAQRRQVEPEAAVWARRSPSPCRTPPGFGSNATGLLVVAGILVLSALLALRLFRWEWPYSGNSRMPPGSISTTSPLTPTLTGAASEPATSTCSTSGVTCRWTPQWPR